MSDLYDVLEQCLQEIEKGTDLETVLARYPKQAQELRPILETSKQAILLASLGPSPEVERRSRAKVLQHAAQMHEAQAQHQVRSLRRLWSVPLRRALVTLAVIGALFISSTRLVEASSTTLPGDNLYPVKRTWEDVRVFLTFNNQAREALEAEHENERLDELNELFTEGRSVKVDFAGTVMSQNGDLWEISTIPVLVSPQTQLSSQPIVIGNTVWVRGSTQSGGTVLAERVELLSGAALFPEVEEEHFPAAGPGTPEGEHQQKNSGEDSSGESSDDEASNPVPTQSPKVEYKSRDFSRNGVVDSLTGDTLVVNGQSMNISDAKIEGTPKPGSKVKVEGYFDANGVFVVTRIEVESGDSGSGDSVKDNGSQDSSGENHSNEDDNHDSENENDHGDDNHNSGEGGSGGGDS